MVNRNDEQVRVSTMVVKTGLDVLLSEHIDELKGSKTGIVANPASVTGDLTHITTALQAAGVKIAALFGPEHGVNGCAGAGTLVADSQDERLGAPVYSLYGANKKPAPESLLGIDLMIVDLQGVGARFYTYESTLANVMTACGERGSPVWVLDRPNPISGTNPEGPILEPEFASFIGMFPIPIRHALTMGEFAQLMVERFGVKCELRVIAMQGWSRKMFWGETNLKWVKPSPNMIKPGTALYYPGTCLFEGTNVSVGRGTMLPFKMIGAQWISIAERSAIHKLIASYDLPGLIAIPVSYTQSIPQQGRTLCHGLSIGTKELKSYRPVVTGAAIISAVRQVCGDKFEFSSPGEDGRRHFDLLAGTDKLRHRIEAGQSPWDIAASWEEGVADYWRDAQEILFY
ncbi:MAG: DUF1343 domain-containing protein [Armatimonadetes bacterium]|nr:DUF1343 domain-containing protein [Armatimonadota bacterium]